MPRRKRAPQPPSPQDRTILRDFARFLAEAGPAPPQDPAEQEAWGRNFAGRTLSPASRALAGLPEQDRGPDQD